MIAVLGNLILLWLILCSAVHAQTLAVIDKSRPADADLSQAQLNILAQAVRGQARKALPEGISVMSEENTVSILRDMGVNLADCIGDCEVEVARKLQADWLISLAIVKLGQGWTLQLNLFDTASAELDGSERGRATSEEELERLALEKTGLLTLLLGSRTAAPTVGPIGGGALDWEMPSAVGVLVQFESIPPGATVTLDGSYLGETPFSREIQPGPHAVKYSLARYEDLNERITLKQKSTLARTLTPLFGWLSVTSEPSAQPVFLDGQTAGHTPVMDLMTGHGAHTILVGDSLLSYPVGERLILEKGERKALSYNLVLRTGGLVVRCEDSKGNAVEVPVSIDGEAAGSSPLQLKLPIGEYEVQAGGVRQTVRLREKAVETVMLTVAPMTITSSGQGVAGDLPGMTFVTIPAGTYTIGSPSSETGRGSDEAQYQVILSAYEMMTTEVTQAQWRAVMGSNPSSFKGDNLPVERVSWHDVQDFLDKLNRQHPGRNYRLPTEAEWEVACRAGATGRYCNGYSEAKLAEVAWYSANSDGMTHPVAKKQPNAWGLYDMHGNVWEWCQDWYGSYDGGTQRDPRGPGIGSGRVYRGGSWNSGASYLRCANRYSGDPGVSYNFLGFRLSRTP